MNSTATKRPYYFFIIIIIIGFTANAQKLPNIQPGGVRAPADAKVDGKAIELNNQFQAYNHATDVFYTLANDDNNLYLTIQATDAHIIRNIINGSISFTIIPSGNKTDNNKIVITYPLYASKEKPTIRDARSFQSLNQAPPTDKELDSLIRLNDKKVRDFARTIRVAGIKTVDTLISVYNEDGIKASSGIGPKMTYTYELAISLKHLGLNVTTPTMFAYNVMINEVEEKGIAITKDENGNTTMRLSTGAQRGQAATDFWGEYTLVKK